MASWVLGVIGRGSFKALLSFGVVCGFCEVFWPQGAWEELCRAPETPGNVTKSTKTFKNRKNHKKHYFCATKLSRCVWHQPGRCFMRLPRGPKGPQRPPNPPPPPKVGAKWCVPTASNYRPLYTRPLTLSTILTLCIATFKTQQQIDLRNSDLEF